ncbi:MAG: S8 family serine peptidase, partial [Elusimicrobia bacterium]|nr:S8 family serine peptidase [Elusimicrobiota bacterium]
ADNGIGIAGVCWNAKLMPIKVFPNNSNYTNAETCARAILYAVDNGAKIISASWGSANNSNLLNDAIKYANDRGVIMVFAAGNNNSSQAYYPAANPLVISVGATDNKDTKAIFSNYGDWIDVFAPGVDIYSTCPNNTYGSKSGTSSSCPFVAGLAGLILSKYPNLSPLEVKQNIKEKADWIGFSNNMAKRRINAFRSLIFSQSNFCIGQEGGSIELLDGTRLDFPAGLTSEKLFIYMGELNSNSYDILKANNSSAINGIVFPIGNFNLIRYFAATSASTGQNISNFENYVRISIPYPDSNNSGFIDGTNIQVKNLKLCYLDQDKTKWVILHNSIVDTAKKIVSAQVNHFSIFGILLATQAQDTSEIIVYPNPLYAAKDPIMKFGRIPLNMTDVKITIFNVAGELVKTLSEQSEIKTLGTEKCAEWNATNNSGEKVASGVYIYVLRSGDSKQKSGKIAVLR